jgi:hypothetical protein
VAPDLRFFFRSHYAQAYRQRGPDIDLATFAIVPVLALKDRLHAAAEILVAGADTS